MDSAIDQWVEVTNAVISQGGECSEDPKLQTELEFDPELLVRQRFTMESQGGPPWKNLC